MLQNINVLINEPNFWEPKMNLNHYPKTDYGNLHNIQHKKTNPIKPNFWEPKMKLNYYPTTNYKNLHNIQHKKTNPIQSQSNPFFGNPFYPTYPFFIFKTSMPKAFNNSKLKTKNLKLYLPDVVSAEDVLCHFRWSAQSFREVVNKHLFNFF